MFCFTPYLGQKSSKSNPKLFVPELFRDIYRVHSAPAFSPDGQELFWENMFMPGVNNAHKLWHMKMENGRWQAPQLASFAGFTSGGPTFSPNGKVVVFQSMRATKKEPQKKIWIYGIQKN